MPNVLHPRFFLHFFFWFFDPSPHELGHRLLVLPFVLTPWPPCCWRQNCPPWPSNAVYMWLVVVLHSFSLGSFAEFFKKILLLFNILCNNKLFPSLTVQCVQVSESCAKKFPENFVIVLFSMVTTFQKPASYSFITDCNFTSDL